MVRKNSRLFNSLIGISSNPCELLVVSALIIEMISLVENVLITPKKMGVDKQNFVLNSIEMY